MGAFYIFFVREVGDSAGEFDDAVVASRREIKPDICPG